MEKLKELQDLAIWMTGCGYDFTQHEHFLKNKHLLTDEAINNTHSCKSVKEKKLDEAYNKGYNDAMKGNNYEY